MGRTEALKKAQKRYDGKCKQFRIRLRMDNDSDILEWMEKQASVTARIKELIRADIVTKS